MANERIHWVVLVLLLVASISAAGQKSPLVIKGSITEVKVAGTSAKPVAKKDKPWEWDYVYDRKGAWFNVIVRLQYCNQGEVTLIVPTQWAFTNERKKILFLEVPSTDSKVAEAITGFASPGAFDPVKAFVTALESHSPPPAHFAMIEPDRCHESGDKISITSGYKLEVRPNEDKKKRDLEVAIPEHFYFKIQYSLYLKDTLPVANAKRRWSHIGELVTGPNGDIFLETDVIINKLWGD